MKIKALTSFCGVLSMAEGQVLEYDDNEVLQGLLKANYVEDITENETPKRSVNKSESKRNNSK